MLFDTFVTTVWKPSCSKLRECTKVGYESALNCHVPPAMERKGHGLDQHGGHRIMVGLLR